MNLLEAGTGLFETHVHKEDVEAEISRAYNQKVTFGDKATFKCIGDGNGFMSRVLAVEPDWQCDGDKKNLPAQLVVKIASMQNVKSMTDDMHKKGIELPPEEEERLMKFFEALAQKMHNREVVLYNMLSRFGMGRTLLTPEIYFSYKIRDQIPKGFIGMELVPDAKIKHAFVCIEPEKLLPALKALACMEALSLKLTDEERESLSGYSFHEVFGTVLTNDQIALMMKILVGLDEKRFEPIVAKLSAEGDKLLHMDHSLKISQELGMKEVLVHGDLWSANLLWSTDDQGEDFIAKVIDYQLIHFGNPAEDLSRMFLSTMSGADRQHRWEWLTEKFYEYLLQQLDGHPAPYTLEQLKESYRRFFCVQAILVLSILGPVAERGLSYMEESTKDALRQVLIEKVAAIFDDLQHYHDRCNEIYKCSSEGSMEKTEKEVDDHSHETTKTAAKER